MTRIQNLLAMENGIDNSMISQYIDIRGHLCATLSAIIRKLFPEHMNEISDKCMEYLLEMLNSQVSFSNGVGYGQDDALGAVGTLIKVLGKGFEKYMPHFKPYLIHSLENHAEIAEFTAAVDVVTELCLAMGKEFNNYCEEIMTTMLNALRLRISASIDRYVGKTLKFSGTRKKGPDMLSVGSLVQFFTGILMQSKSFHNY